MGPNPVRTLPSLGVIDQKSDDFEICPGMDCEMISIKVNSDQIRYVEQCRNCGWIDGASLSWWAEDAIKSSGSRLAQRIAVAASTEPFSFAQGSGEDLTLHEILYQALGAASMCWEDVESAGVFNSSRAAAIGQALLAEVTRFQKIEAGKALSAARRRIAESWIQNGDDLTRQAVLDAIR